MVITFRIHCCLMVPVPTVLPLYQRIQEMACSSWVRVHLHVQLKRQISH